MYQAKRKGGGSHQIIDLREALRTLDHDSLEADLRIAFADDSSTSPTSRRAQRRRLMTGVEALLRWTDPLRGQVSPAARRASRGAEHADQSRSAPGSWSVACRDRGTLAGAVPARTARPRGERLGQPAGHPRLRADRRRGAARDRDGPDGADPGDDREHPHRGHRARDDGAAPSSGTSASGSRWTTSAPGYSSLSYLRRLPIHIVKIDQGFIADIGRAPEGREIAAAVTNLAHVLGLSR